MSEKLNPEQCLWCQSDVTNQRCVNDKCGAVYSNRRPSKKKDVLRYHDEDFSNARKKPYYHKDFQII